MLCRQFLERVAVVVNEFGEVGSCLRDICPITKATTLLNLAYYSLLDGLRLQDIELRRNDEAFLDGLGA